MDFQSVGGHLSRRTRSPSYPKSKSEQRLGDCLAAWMVFARLHESAKNSPRFQVLAWGTLNYENCDHEFLGQVRLETDVFAWCASRREPAHERPDQCHLCVETLAVRERESIREFSNPFDTIGICSGIDIQCSGSRSNG